MTEPSRPPRWAWTFVVAGVLGLVALCAPWFSEPETSWGVVDYSARDVFAATHSYLGVVGPVFLAVWGGIWWSALMGWSQLPANTQAWLGRRGVLGWLGSDVDTADPVRLACGFTAGVGALALLLLGVVRGLEPSPNWLVRPVQLQFGGWCILVAGSLQGGVGLLGFVARSWIADRSARRAEKARRLRYLE